MYITYHRQDHRSSIKVLDSVMLAQSLTAVARVVLTRVYPSPLKKSYL
jgi:hypothetical protein